MLLESKNAEPVEMTFNRKEAGGHEDENDFGDPFEVSSSEQDYQEENHTPDKGGGSIELNQINTRLPRLNIDEV